MTKIHSILFILFLFLAGPGVAQQGKDAKPGSLLRQLQDAYNAFDMQKSTELLNIALSSLDSFEADEQVEIYKYAAFIAFQNYNSTLAANHFWNLLGVDPTYTLDPVTTSPKALALFQKTKIEYLEDMNKRLQALQKPPADVDAPAWRSLAPGWEQWRRGYKIKGGALASTAALSLSGLVYAVYQTQQSKDAYRNEQNPEAIPPLYDDYNRNYRMQYYFGYAFAAVWALSQMDLVLWSPSGTQTAIAPKFGNSYRDFGVVLSLRFKPVH